MAPVRPLDLPHEREHRGRVLARCVDADREVGRADRSGPDARRWSTGQVPVGLGHERRSALVARGDHPDPDLVQGLEQTEEGLARHGERVANAGHPERVRHEPATVRGPVGSAGKATSSARVSSVG